MLILLFLLFVKTELLNHFSSFFFFFNDTATTEIYTLSLHDALPISGVLDLHPHPVTSRSDPQRHRRSEEHTSELQSHLNLVCRLLLEKKKKYYVEQHKKTKPHNGQTNHKSQKTT